MLDIKFIRENLDLVKEGARKKHAEVNFEGLLALDEKRRALMTSVEKKRAEHNLESQKVAAMSPMERQKVLGEMKYLKESMQKEEEELKDVLREWQSLMLQIPNVPDVSVPEGKDENDNVEVYKRGAISQFDFEPKDHVELMGKLGMVDLERGTKVHGFRGYFLIGDGADLSWAIWNYARDFYHKKNFQSFIAPIILKKEFFYGTGHLPSPVDDLYRTQDDDYLSGTAEVPIMAYHTDEILSDTELPKRYLAFSPCYRREAGSYGKDEKGVLRVHEFYKLEQLILCKADHVESEKYHEEINRNFEELVESLGLPYRRLLICGGDLSASKVKQYDTEVWMPAAQKYRELSSASYYHDFQTRRFNIRYTEGGRKRYAHSLNCTAVATPRILAAIVENFQERDGSVKIPSVLENYIGKKSIS